MDLSLRPQQQPEQRMHTVTIEEIVLLGDLNDQQRPPLENYFSPTRRAQFEKDYIHYLNTLLLEMKHGNLELELYLVFVLSFQFIAPLLGISTEREFGQFYKILAEKYDVEELDLNLHFAIEQYEAPSEDLVDALAEEMHDAGQKQGAEHNGRIGEEAALSGFLHELDATYEGRREVKTSVQKRLKQDGIASIMQWQHEKDVPELAEAFGRSVVIPSFFSYKDKKLLEFYRSTTDGITYEVAVPEGDLF